MIVFPPSFPLLFNARDLVLIWSFMLRTQLMLIDVLCEEWLELILELESGMQVNEYFS